MQDVYSVWYQVKTWFLGCWFDIIRAVGLLLIGLWVINKLCRIVAVFLRQTSLDVGIISFLNSTLKFFLRTILILLILSALGINMTSVITAIGASLVTLGIVFKDSLSNFAGGLLLIVNKPIRLGDYIEFENVKGRVAKIEMMFTTLYTADGNSVIIPNFRLASSNIIRQSPYDICKYSFELKVKVGNYATDIKKILEHIFISEEKVLQIPPPEINCENADENLTLINADVFFEKRYFEILDVKIRNHVEESLEKYDIDIVESSYNE